MILYHGSNIVIKDIDLTMSKPNKDFGRAFYLSDNYKQAFELAKYKANILGGQAIVNEFVFNEQTSGLKILTFDTYSFEWAEFVFKNRSEDNYTHPYDIVYGPIANDRVGIQLQNYKEGIITIDELIKRLKYLHGITFQYAFCTQQSLTTLRSK